VEPKVLKSCQVADTVWKGAGQLVGIQVEVLECSQLSDTIREGPVQLIDV